MSRFVPLLLAGVLAASMGCGGSGGGGGGFDGSRSRVLVGADSTVHYTDNGEPVKTLALLTNFEGWNSIYYGVRTEEDLPARIAQAAAWTTDPSARVHVWMDSTGRPTWMRQGVGTVVFFAWQDDLNAVVQTFVPEWTEVGTSRIRFSEGGYEVLPIGTGTAAFGGTPPLPGGGAGAATITGPSEFTIAHLAEMARLLETIHTRTPGLRAFFTAMAGGVESGTTRRDMGLGVDVPEALVIEVAHLFQVNLRSLPRGGEFASLVAGADEVGILRDIP